MPVLPGVLECAAAKKIAAQLLGQVELVEDQLVAIKHIALPWPETRIDDEG